jgi:hypothetical protein
VSINRLLSQPTSDSRRQTHAIKTYDGENTVPLTGQRKHSEWDPLRQRATRRQQGCRRTRIRLLGHEGRVAGLCLTIAVGGRVRVYATRRDQVHTDSTWKVAVAVGLIKVNIIVQPAQQPRDNLLLLIQMIMGIEVAMREGIYHGLVEGREPCLTCVALRGQ